MNSSASLHCQPHILIVRPTLFSTGMRPEITFCHNGICSALVSMLRIGLATYVSIESKIFCRISLGSVIASNTSPLNVVVSLARGRVIVSAEPIDDSVGASEGATTVVAREATDSCDWFEWDRAGSDMLDWLMALHVCEVSNAVSVGKAGYLYTSLGTPQSYAFHCNLQRCCERRLLPRCRITKSTKERRASFFQVADRCLPHRPPRQEEQLLYSLL